MSILVNEFGMRPTILLFVAVAAILAYRGRVWTDLIAIASLGAAGFTLGAQAQWREAGFEMALRRMAGSSIMFSLTAFAGIFVALVVQSEYARMRGKPSRSKLGGSLVLVACVLSAWASPLLGFRRTPGAKDRSSSIATTPANNGLERTRRVGVPASRAVFRVSPCRSTQCSTHPSWIDKNGRVAARKARSVLVRVGVLGFASLLVSCIGAGDIFVPTKDVVAGYKLELTEGSAYYLCQPNGHCGGMSLEPLDGRVRQLGWNESFLVLLMTGPAPDGWYVVDLKTQGVRGPLIEDAFRVMKANEPAIASVRLRSVEEVWPQ